MAYIEMIVTMARVLWLFDMRAVGNLGERLERKDEYRIDDCSICNKHEPMVQFSKA